MTFFEAIDCLKTFLDPLVVVSLLVAVIVLTPHKIVNVLFCTVSIYDCSVYAAFLFFSSINLSIYDYDATS